MSDQNAIEQEQDDRFPSGPWRGFWLQGGYRGQMDLELDFHDGHIAGRGSDPVGEFAFIGSYDTEDGRVLMTKQYIDQHQVQYEGWAELQHGIWGLWSLIPSLSAGERGGWQIRPVGHGTQPGQHAHAEQPRELALPAPARRK